MAGETFFKPEVFVGQWNIVTSSRPGAQLLIVFKNGKFSIVHEGVVWQQDVDVNSGTAALENEDLSVSFWERGYPESRKQIMAMEVSPEGSGVHFMGEGGVRYSVLGCDFKASVAPPRKPPSFSPSFRPEKFTRKTWRVEVQHGDTGGRCNCRQWIKISRCPPRNRLLVLSASESRNGPWQLYDVLVYNRAVGSLDSILHHRSICYWQRGATSTIYAMFDSRPVVSSQPQIPAIRLMPVEEQILKWTDQDEEGGAGVWGAEEGG